MTMLALCLAALCVLAVLIFAVYLMFEDGFTACYFLVCGVPQNLGKALCWLLSAIWENAGELGD